MKPVMLQARNLSVHAGGKCLCEGLNLSIHSGEAWIILGENGSGKSTLMNALSGWSPPAHGEILLAGEPVSSWPRQERSKRLGWMTQRDVVTADMSVLDLVLAGSHTRQSRWTWESQSDIDAALQQLAKLDMQVRAQQRLDTLSGGERRRAALAALLMQQSDILLLDEPLTALDPRHQQQALQALHEERVSGKSILFISHDPNHAHALATHALLLQGEGQWLAGPLATTLTEENLTATYHSPIRKIDTSDGVFFVSLPGTR